MRRWWVLWHRWVGLVLTLFLVIAGLTGVLLAWSDPIEALVAPKVFVAPATGSARLDPLAMREIVAARYPSANANLVELDAKPGKTAMFYLTPKPGAAALANDEVFVDPASGAITGARKTGDISQGLKNLMPFVLRLHYGLVAGVIGSYVFGIAAILWTIDCFVGAWLTLPVRRMAGDFPGVAGPTPSWWSRWAPAWRVRWGSNAHKLNFDVHRAGGLWLWALLFVFAVSSVSLTLPQVYRPVARAALGYTDVYGALPNHPVDRPPALGWREAHAAAQARMLNLAHRRGFTVVHETWLSYDPFKHAYAYRVRGSGDLSLNGHTGLYIDADTGALLAVETPETGSPGDRITAWFESLHMADAFGWPYQIVVSAVGGGVVALSVTGVVIWSKKRAARAKRRALIARRHMKAAPTHLGRPISPPKTS